MAPDGHRRQDEDCPHFQRAKANASTIKAIWSDGEYSWRYETAIPCERFVVKEDGEPYCQGIVFALADAA